MHFLNIFWEERKSLWFSSIILVNCLPKINRYWTIFETLAEIERGCKEQQLCIGDCCERGRVKDFEQPLRVYNAVRHNSGFFRWLRRPSQCILYLWKETVA